MALLVVAIFDIFDLLSLKVVLYNLPTIQLVVDIEDELMIDLLPYLAAFTWILGYAILVKLTTSGVIRWPWSNSELRGGEAYILAEKTSFLLFFWFLTLPLFALLLLYKRLHNTL